MLLLPVIPQLQRGRLTAGIRQALTRLDAFTLTTFDTRTPAYRD